MKRDLPPLNAVRMFEAAARHGNFTRAAEQLNVTQGAVSRQIKQLERALNRPLFERDGPNVRLTHAGRKYYESVREGLDAIRRATDLVADELTVPTITLSVLPSFATKWLVARLADFQEKIPGIEIRVIASYDLVDLVARPDIDAAIRFGSGNWNGVYRECLFQERVFPVCSPDFVRKYGPFRRPADLLKVPTIHAAESCDEWARWLEAAGVESSLSPGGARFSDQIMLHQAAIRGHGAIVAHSLLVADELASGRLIRLFDISVEARYMYYFVCESGRETEARLALFLEWLRGEAVTSGSACENLLQDAV